MDGARRPFLAAARFAADHHRRHAARQAHQRAAHLLHGSRVAGQQLARAFCQIGIAGIGIALLAPQRVEHEAAQLVERERLGDVVERTSLERFHCVLGAAVCRDDGHRRAVGSGGELAHEFDAQTVAQAHVGQHERKALTGQRLARFGQAAGKHHVVPHAAQGDLQQLAQVGFVIDDEDGFANDGGFGHGSAGQRNISRRFIPLRPGRVDRTSA